MKFLSTMHVNQLLFIGLISLLALQSCKPENPVIEADPFEEGIFVTNEGNFNTGNSSISFYNPKDGEVKQDIFLDVNGRALGDVLQSMNIANGKAYMVVNNSNKIEVADAGTFKEIATITGLESPRYFLAVDENKAYVTQWGAGGSVAVVDLNSNTVTSTIPVGSGPENLVMRDDKVYVANSGGYSYDSTVTVINTTNDQVETSIALPYNPKSLLFDANGKLWVLCKGKKIYDPVSFEFDETNSSVGTLVRINGNTLTPELNMEFGEKRPEPEKLLTDGTGMNLYYSYNGGVYMQSVSAVGVSTTPLITGSFYGLSFNQEENVFYAADAGDFASAGTIKRYEANGTLIDEFTSGIIPGGFFFKD